jgi:dihydrofolate synthase / folylpolyglutamate synthase
MDYPQSLKWLENLAAFGIKTGTDHTRTIAKHLGSPHLNIPSILVGGTNGKGSTSAYIESILRESGHKTAFFTSPHLVDIRERIRIGGELVPKPRFAFAVSKVKDAFQELKKKGAVDEAPTFFEALTLAAFFLFSSEKADIAIVEVGMGGKNDCTNILEPFLSIVTNVSFDHQQYLGKTITEIAAEKAGIFRKGKTAVVGRTSKASFPLLQKEATAIGAKFISIGEFKLKEKKHGYSIDRGKTACDFPNPPLLGKHQIDNAALAVLAVSELVREGYKIDQRTISDGIKKCRWRGRLEKILLKPDTYLDGAHNLDGIKTVKQFAQGFKAKKVLLFSAMKDKPMDRMVKLVSPQFEKIIFTEIPMARAAKKEDFQKLIEELDACFVQDPAEALSKARKEAGKDGIVIAAGSLYLAGYILKHLEDKDAPLWGIGL